jgi:uncharacterized membrane protein
MMYKILGGDGKEYGPVTADTLRQWITEGRANALTQIKPEGATAWQALSSLPELADLFGAALTGVPPVAGAATGVHDGDYDLDIGGCIGRSFEAFKNNMGPVLLAMLIYFGVIIGLAILGMIPFIGILASLTSFVIGGPLLGGVYFVLLQAARRRAVNPSDLFAGFSGRFIHLFLGHLLPSVFAGLCMIPVAVVFLVGLLPWILTNQSTAPENLTPPVGAMVATGVAALVCLPVVLWLTINWMFTLLLVIDKQLDFWTAMKTSWRQVMRHWWTMLGLVIICGLINIAGVLACCVGTLFTFPIVMGAIVQAYETMFTPRAAQPGPGA